MQMQSSCNGISTIRVIPVVSRMWWWKDMIGYGAAHVIKTDHVDSDMVTLTK